MKVSERIYELGDVISFQKNNDPYGDLSNMASKFPLLINNIVFRNNEALYQVCRFPNHPEAQQEIIDQKSPMAVKYKSRSYKHLTRVDWDDIKVNVMRWCLKVKLVQHSEAFGEVLLSTKEKQIVEFSKVDPFWGAKPYNNSKLKGCNVLGRLLMELRENYEIDPSISKRVEPLRIRDFLLLGNQIDTIYPYQETPNIKENENRYKQIDLPFE